MLNLQSKKLINKLYSNTKIVKGKCLIGLGKGIYTGRIANHLDISKDLAIEEKIRRMKDNLNPSDLYSYTKHFTNTYRLNNMNIEQKIAKESRFIKIPDISLTVGNKPQYYGSHDLDANWGTARISSMHRLDLNEPLIYRYKPTDQYYNKFYIFDSGINISHSQFRGRARNGINCVEYEPHCDYTGHGTHVAGIIGSERYGVLPNANLISVKVCDFFDNTTESYIIDGIKYVENEVKKQGVNSGINSIVNMSLGGEYSKEIDDCIEDSIKKYGIHYCVSAGNHGVNAIKTSPGSTYSAVTVGHTDIYDIMSCDSGYGCVVDILASGVNILSTSIDNNYATAYLSGSSMACAFVSGLMGYYLAMYPKKGDKDYKGQITPAQLKEILINSGHKRQISKVPFFTPNLLVYNNYYK